MLGEHTYLHVSRAFACVTYIFACVETSELVARDVRNPEGLLADRATATLPMGLLFLKSSLEVDSRE
jgi:hypothetical protein